MGGHSSSGIRFAPLDEQGNPVADIPKHEDVFAPSLHTLSIEEMMEDPDTVNALAPVADRGMLPILDTPDELWNVALEFTLYRSGLYRTRWAGAVKTDIEKITTITVPKRFRDRIANEDVALPPVTEPEPGLPTPVGTGPLTKKVAKNDLARIEELLREAPASGGFS